MIRFTLTRMTGLIFALLAPLSAADTAVEVHGALTTQGNRIVDANSEPLSLAGPSLFWSNTGWGADRYYNADVVAHVQKHWNAPIIRAAIGAGENGGYLTHPEENRAKAERVIDAAIEQGMYVILDWHAHHAEDHPEQAVAFFKHFAQKYGHTPNLIYEIYNEPLKDTDWDTVIKPYAERVIDAIRDIDPDNLIIVGTQSWSQDVDKSAANPIEGADNVAYTLHFYAGTHTQWLRDRAARAMEDGIPLMVTEWGTVNANGDGGVDRDSTEQWLEFMREHKLTHANWALNDKDEGASMLKPGARPDGQWTDEDLTESGRMIKSVIKNWHQVDYTGAAER